MNIYENFEREQARHRVTLGQAMPGIVLEAIGVDFAPFNVTSKVTKNRLVHLNLESF
ncbi:unannotated protein [freshwater metagenome]|uniref:Unannotated protein n=1 Tax=freshwater metagenome TaxID=449393 RepID=A0A6J6JBE0_9ZZZZ